MLSLRRHFARLKDLSFDKGTVTVHWTGEKVTTVPLVWLRDNVEKGARGRMMTSMKVQSMTLDERKDMLVIKWVDRPPDVYTGQWLESRLLTDPNSLTTVAQSPLTSADATTPLFAQDVFAETGRKSLFEKVIKTGFVRIKDVEKEKLMNWLFSDMGKPVKSRCGELHTEGAFWLEVPKIALFTVDKPTKIRLLDSASFSSENSLLKVLPAFGVVEGSFECWGDGVRFRAKHAIFKGGKIVYSEQWRDSQVCDREFYAVLGHFHQYLSETKSVIEIEVSPDETVFIDNFRLLHDRSPGTETITALTLSEFQGRAAAEGLALT